MGRSRVNSILQAKIRERPHEARQQKLVDLPGPNPRCFEDALSLRGVELIAGVDEAGRGCLAGPVVASAVILPQRLILEGLKDSKQLSSTQRDNFFDAIKAHALAWSVGIVDPSEIDQINILKASLKAMKIAVEKLKIQPEHLLIDGPFGIELNIPQRPIIKGDALSHSISAASVVAKVTRDRMMSDYEGLYPSFKFSAHKGYGTRLHYDELQKNGPTAIHRMTFAGVRPTDEREF